MDYQVKQSGSVNSVAEDLFVELFCDTFGPDKSQFLFIQYPVTDIYGNRRFIDFARGSIQSISKSIKEFDPDDFGYVIIDECHHGTAKTLSKTLYLQQLGRGMRKSLGKEYLMIFDFIDNANLFNIPYSLHRVFNIKEYQAGKYIIASQNKFELDKDLLAKGEKPSAYLDFPYYELIDLFNWQDQAKDMISQIEFVRMVDGQSETIDKYIRDSKIKPDLEVPIGDTRKFKYFKEETIYKYAKEFNWDFINVANMKDKFMEMVKTMDMSYSYKPILLKAMFEHTDKDGKVRVEDIVSYFINFYEDRKAKGLVVDKPASLYCKDNYTRKDVERNIFTNPFKRFEDMRFMKRCREVEYVEFNKHVFKKLLEHEIEWILGHCEAKLREYYGRDERWLCL